MSLEPYILIDFTRGYGPFPAITHGYRYSPDYSAKRTDKGADAFLNGEMIASFDSMDAACKFVTEQAKRHDPWFGDPPAAKRSPNGGCNDPRD